jgi:hypothetical protein
MGCDIDPYVEIKTDGIWASLDAPESLSFRHYVRFAFLTGGEVKNVAGVPAVLPSPRGYPADASFASRPRRGCNASYLTLKELLAVNYQQTFTDLRVNSERTLFDVLDPSWFYILASLEAMLGGRVADELRIVFDFDQ